jgi:uncharacterized protein (TIGR02453 family)
MKTTITKETFDFLTLLKNNNNRDWFNAHKDLYHENHQMMIDFADDVLEKMNKIDHIETVSGKKSLYRIYRDTRFSKNKTPYKTHWGGFLSRATQHLRGGYYFHIEPGNSFVGGGFWKPNPEDLKRIREDIAMDDTELRKILADKKFKNTFDELMGEQVKTAPKGYKKDHMAIDLLRFKQFLVMKKFANKEVLADNFTDKVVETFVAMRPFFDYMSGVLTTNANGEPLHGSD